MKKLSNTEAQLKTSIAYKKSVLKKAAKIFAWGSQKLWSTWKTHKGLAFKPGQSRNERFQEETGRQELSFQNRSLSFKTGELELFLTTLVCYLSGFLKLLLLAKHSMISVP